MTNESRLPAVVLVLLMGLSFNSWAGAEPNAPAAPIAGKNYVIMVGGINRDPDERQRKTRTIMRLHRYFTDHMKLEPSQLNLLIDRDSYIPLAGKT